MERELEVLIDGILNISQQCALTVKRTKHILEYIMHSTTSWSSDGIVLFYSALVQPHLKYCMQFWVTQCKKDIKLSEKVQRKAMKIVRGKM